MRYIRTGLAVVASGAVLALTWLLIPQHQEAASKSPRHVTEPAPSPKSSSEPSGQLPTAASHENTGPAVPSKKRRDYHATLKASHDYWALAHETLLRARSGDPEAQYLMWEIDRQCRSGYTAFLEDRGKALNLDEALQRAALWNQPAESVRLAYSRCHRFYDSDTSELGDPKDWLRRATDAGYPLAQAMSAGLKLTQAQAYAFVRAGAVPTGQALGPPVEGGADPRTLLQSAVRSVDPEVLWQIGSLQKLLNPGESAEEHRLNSWAWQYLACLHGVDCSSYGEPVMNNCSPSDTHCTGVPAKMLAAVGNDWTPIARRADEIDSALNDKQWDQLPGLSGPPQPR